MSAKTLYWIRTVRGTKTGPWHIEEHYERATYCGVTALYRSTKRQDRNETLDKMTAIAGYSQMAAKAGGEPNNAHFTVCGKCIRKASA